MRSFTKIYQLAMVVCLLPIVVLATERISVSEAGVQGDNSSNQPSISADGRYTAFTSYSSNLIDGVNIYNNANDIYIHDSTDNSNVLVSTAVDPWEQADGNSSDPVISADGRYVVFATDAGNLDPDGNCQGGNIFMYGLSDLKCISVSSSGTEGNHASDQPDISEDGSCIVFRSAADNLVAGDTNNRTDIFIHTIPGGNTERINKNIGGGEANGDGWLPSISADGDYVAFASDASDLHHNDKNGDVSDIFLRDWRNSKTELISVNSLGEQSNGWSDNPSISANGRYVVFDSNATNLVPGDTNGEVDVFIRDRETNTTERISVSSLSEQGNGGSFIASVSADGRYVTFISDASNLVPGDTNALADIFVRDRIGKLTKRISVDTAGKQGNSFSWLPDISDDGKHVAFVSWSSNLVPGDTNNAEDIFVNDVSFTYLPAFTTAPLFDSGWQTISAGEEYMINHMVGGNVNDYVVYLIGMDSNGKTERYCYGGCDIGNERVGFYWYDLNETAIFVKRRNEDPVTEQIRVQVWRDPNPDFDSGWQFLLPGDTGPLAHNLGGSVDDYIVDLEFADWPGHPPHQMLYGGITFGNKTYGGSVDGQQWGAYWHSLTDTTVNVVRMPDDQKALMFRGRIWKRPNPDGNSGWVTADSDKTKTVTFSKNIKNTFIYYEQRSSAKGVNHGYYGGFGASNTQGAYWNNGDNAKIDVRRNKYDTMAEQVRVRTYENADQDGAFLPAVIMYLLN